MPALLYAENPALGHGKATLYSTILFTLTCTNSWFYPFSNLPFVLASWTVNTFFFFYLVFPLALPKIQKLTDLRLARGIVILFWLQFVPFTILSICLPEYSCPFSINPVSRLPVFLMGVMAGLQNIRRAQDQDNFNDPNLHRPWIHNLLLWGVTGENKTLRIPNSEQEEEDGDEVKVWRKRVDQGSGTVFLYMVGSTVMVVSLGYYVQGGNRNSCLSFILDWQPLISVFGQFFLVHQLLIIIVGLSRDQGKSYLSRVCSTRLSQFFGRISMTLYLLHRDMPLYLLWPFHPHLKFDPQARPCFN